MKKKLLILVCCCWALIFGMVAFSSNIASALMTLGLEEPGKAVLSWIFGLAVVIGAGVPFCIWAIAVSTWGESIIKVSVIYGKRED